jgi:hypothetical protein
MLAGHARNLFAWGKLGDPVAAVVGLLPGLELLNGIDAGSAGIPIPLAYVVLAALYALLYVLALLLLGAAWLHGRELT